MTPPRAATITGFQNELQGFEQLIRSLDRDGWNAPTRCEGWAVADVAAHVTGTLADITAGRFEGLGTQETIDRHVAERRGRSADEVADELRGAAKAGADILGAVDDEAWNGPAPAGLSPTMGEGVEVLWYDAYVHGDDIRVAAGLPSERGDGLRASVVHVAVLLERDGWGPATLALDGMDEVEIGGGGKRVTGDPLDFVLVATGRKDPAMLDLDETVNLYRPT